MTSVKVAESWIQMNQSPSQCDLLCGRPKSNDSLQEADGDSDGDLIGHRLFLYHFTQSCTCTCSNIVRLIAVEYCCLVIIVRVGQ